MEAEYVSARSAWVQAGERSLVPSASTYPRGRPLAPKALTYPRVGALVPKALRPTTSREAWKGLGGAHAPQPDCFPLLLSVKKIYLYM